MGTIVSTKKWSDEELEDGSSLSAAARARVRFAAARYMSNVQKQRECRVNEKQSKEENSRMAEGGQKWMKDPGLSEEEMQHALPRIPNRRREVDFGFNLQSVDLQGDANPTEKQLQPLPENANINQEETHGATRSMASLKMVGMEKKSNIASLVGIQVRPSSGELATGGSEVEEDSLTQLMYEEIAEDELVSELEGHAKVTEEETDKLQESGNSWPPDLPSFRQSLRKEIQAHRKNPPDAHGEHQHSILIAPPSRKIILKAAEFRGGVVNKLKHLPSALKFEYHQFMTDVDQTTFYARQQVETGLMDYTPQKVLLISSNVPKAMMLKEAARPDVHCHVYNFAEETFQDIHDRVKSMLEGYKEGAKAKYLGIVCKGGPGYLYLLRKVPVTSVKLRKNKELLNFWKTLGVNMSKLFPGESVIHFMESNVAGNKQGEKLLEDLEIAMYSHQVKVQSPIELAPSGRDMISLYFDPLKHKLWKSERYMKFQMYK